MCGGSSNDSPHLQFVKAERKVQDLCELLGQSLLSLQVLHGSVGWAGQRLQQAAQGVFWKATRWHVSNESTRAVVLFGKQKAAAVGF